MSWQHPPPGPAWNQGIAHMTPDMMNVGSFTAEQWAIIQQQNWQQWTQWQQQYAQWQSQYGEKYAQQMQNMMVGGVPPPPPQTAPPAPPAPPVPPAPPPPDKPPPPNENNQPLYGSPQSLAPVPPPIQHLLPPVPPSVQSFPPVPPPAQKPQTPASVNSKVSDKVNWVNASKNVWSTNNSQSNVSQPETHVQTSINSEALKKLAEEEKQFDIQFRKWEEEIEKWKRENVNHPDKQAYQEYEAKFEACRAQLLERRQQMKQKRTHLMDGSQLETHRQESRQAEIQISESQKAVSKPLSDRVLQNRSTPDKPVQNDSKLDRNNFESSEEHSQNEYGKDVCESHSSETNNSTFLRSNESLKGIPGLDLVGNTEESKQQPKNLDIIDITDEQSIASKPKTNVDFGALTKGIHNILEDEKIMNMLSMVRGQNTSTSYQSPDLNRPRNQIFDDARRNDQNFHQNKPNEETFPQNRQINHQNRSIDRGFNQDRSHDQGMFRDTSYNQERRNNQSFTQNRPNYQGFNQNRLNNQTLKQNGINDQSFIQNRYSDQNYSNPNKQIDQAKLQGNYGQSKMSYASEQGKTDSCDQWNLSKSLNSGRKHEFKPNEAFKQPPPLMQIQPIEQYNRSIAGPSQPMMTSNISSKMDVFSDSDCNKNTEFNKSNIYNHNDNFFQHGLNSQDNTQELIEQSRRGHEQNIPQRINHFHANQNMPQERSTLQDMTNQPCTALGVDKSISISETIHSIEPKWKDEPILIPSVIVEYEHKPLRLKARDFIEPVQIFDYNHKSKDDEYKSSNIDISENILFQRKRDLQLRRSEIDDHPRSHGSIYKSNRENHDHISWDKEFENYDRMKFSYKDDSHNDPYMKGSLRDARDIREMRDIKDIKEIRDKRSERERYDDRKPYDGKYYERRREEREKYSRQDDSRDRYKERYSPEDRREGRFSPQTRSRSRDRDLRKKAYSKDTEIREHKMGPITISKDKNLSNVQPISIQRSTIVMIDDLLEPPGRDARPEKIVIILRGAPGSGKSYLAQLIRDREIKNAGNVRIMSIDDYFMQEAEVEEKDPTTGKMVKKTVMKYEYDAASEEIYFSSLKKAFKRSITDGFHPFLIFDAVNESLKCYADIWNYSKQNGFQVYVCTMEMDAQTCFKRNIHNRTLADIESVITRFFKTPAHHITLDPTTLLQSAGINDVHMEDVDNEDDTIMEDAQEEEVTDLFTSKWDKMEDADKLDRLDGTSKPLRPSHYSMEDYLQLDDWQPTIAKPGKKTVRWADIEERRQQEKMRAVGFVLGQTDWERMTDPTLGSSALTQTKYIERVRRN